VDAQLLRKKKTGSPHVRKKLNQKKGDFGVRKNGHPLTRQKRAPKGDGQLTWERKEGFAQIKRGG